MQGKIVLAIVGALTGAAWASATFAQQRPSDVATSSAGRAGERQVRGTLDAAGIEPMARLDSRIANRVQSRLRSRIDRFYDPQANASSPFTVASEQARTTGQTPRR